MGGIYDHLGGGFARYSTDARWLVPHFEKMLYDNALLVPCYLEAYQATGEPFYPRDRRGDAGLGAARDDQSGGAVLQHPRRRQRRARRASSTSGRRRRSSRFSARSDGRSVQRGLRRRAGRQLARGAAHDPRASTPTNILHRTKTFTQYARLHRMDEASCVAGSTHAGASCFEVRSRRVWPGRDEKALTSWNGLMIGAFALAAQVLDEPRLRRRRRPGRRLHPDADAHRRTAGCCAPTAPAREPKLNAYLEDYAFLIEPWCRCTRRRSTALDRGGAGAGRRDDRAVLGRDRRRLLLHRPRSRSADRPHQGSARQRDAVGQLDGGDGSAAAGEADGAKRSASERRRRRCGCIAACWRRTRWRRDRC